MASQDRLQLYPSQNADHRPDECVAESVADIVGNLVGLPIDPGFTFGATEHLSGVQPNTGGSNPLAGMQSAIIYGALSISQESFTATTTSELFEANFANYSPQQKQDALTFAQKGVISLSSYQDIITFLSKGWGGVSIAFKWSQTFETPLPGGTLSTPSGSFSNHNVACYESTLQGLALKSWQGPTYGQNGLAYMTENIFNQSFVSAAGFNPTAWKWLSLVQIALQHTNAILDILPLLST